MLSTVSRLGASNDLSLHPAEGTFAAFFADQLACWKRSRLSRRRLAGVLSESAISIGCSAFSVHTRRAHVLAGSNVSRPAGASLSATRRSYWTCRMGSMSRTTAYSAAGRNDLRKRFVTKGSVVTFLMPTRLYGSPWRSCAANDVPRGWYR